MAHIKVTDSRDSGVNLEIRQTIFSGWLVSKILLIIKKVLFIFTLRNIVCKNIAYKK